MDLFEYQARDVFAAHDVPVLDGAVAETPEEARAAAERLGGGRVVVKAQVKTGGRGKAGGVKLADDPADAEAKAAQILGMDIKGHPVHRVMLAPADHQPVLSSETSISTASPVFSRWSSAAAMPPARFMPPVESPSPTQAWPITPSSPSGVIDQARPDRVQKAVLSNPPTSRSGPLSP